MFRGLAIKLGQKLGVHWALGIVREIAEGRYGEDPIERTDWKRRYDFMVGKKRWTGFLLAIGAGVLVALGHDNGAMALSGVAAFAFQAGILDEAWRTEVPPGIREWPLFQVLAQNSAGLTALFASCWAWLQAGCVGGACLYYKVGLAVLATAAAQAGLVDAAWRARPPYPRLNP